MEQGVHTSTASGHAHLYVILEINMRVSQKIGTVIPQDPAVSLLTFTQRMLYLITWTLAQTCLAQHYL